MSIIIGDLHLKEKEPYFTFQKKFLEWINSTYPDKNLIFLGDCFDTSAPPWEIYYTFKEFLSSRKSLVYLLSGNHDYSKLKGNSLESFNLMDNVIVITEPQEITIKNKKCLFLPFKYSTMKEEYEQLRGEYDYVFSHITHPNESFGDDGIDLSNIDCPTFIYGHIHLSNFHSTKNQEHYILGVPLPTRHGEKMNHKIMNISQDDFMFIDIPKYFEYETVKFGDDPLSENNILNIVDAPDVSSVFQRYKGYYIRQEGIKLLRSEDDINIDSFKDLNISQQYKQFSQENGIAKEINQCILQHFSEAGI